MGERTHETKVLGKQINKPSEDLDLIEWDSGETLVSLKTSEFTSHCPVTGAPDFATIEIEYTPKKHIVETKSFKLWMWAFRDKKQFNEKIVNEIADTFFEKVHPVGIIVTGTFSPRGGVRVKCIAKRGE